MTTQIETKQTPAFFEFDLKKYNAGLPVERLAQLSAQEAEFVRLYKRRETGEEVRVIEVFDYDSVGILARHFDPLEELGLVKNTGLSSNAHHIHTIKHLSPSGRVMWKQEFHYGNTIVLSTKPLPRAEVVDRLTLFEDYERLYESIDQVEMYQANGMLFVGVKYTQNNKENITQLVKFFERNRVSGVSMHSSNDWGLLVVEDIAVNLGSYVIGCLNSNACVYNQTQREQVFRTYEGAVSEASR